MYRYIYVYIYLYQIVYIYIYIYVYIYGPLAGSRPSFEGQIRQLWGGDETTSAVLGSWSKSSEESGHAEPPPP